MLDIIRQHCPHALTARPAPAKRRRLQQPSSAGDNGTDAGASRLADADVDVNVDLICGRTFRLTTKYIHSKHLVLVTLPAQQQQQQQQSQAGPSSPGPSAAGSASSSSSAEGDAAGSVPAKPKVSVCSLLDPSSDFYVAPMAGGRAAAGGDGGAAKRKLPQ